MNDTKKMLANINLAKPKIFISEHVPSWLKRASSFVVGNETHRNELKKDCVKNIGLQTQKQHVPSWPRRAPSFINE